MHRAPLPHCHLLLGFFAMACGLGQRGEAPGTGLTPGEQTAATLHLSGRVEPWPEALRLLPPGSEPRWEGLGVRAEEPLRVAVNDPGALLGHGTVGPGGEFSIAEVAVHPVHQSLAVSLEEHPTLVPSATIVFDTAHTGAPPRMDLLAVRVWALPRPLHEALSRAVGEARLQTLTEGRARTLQQAGFVLGRVVDEQGAPVAGARVEPERGELAHRVLYPTEDLQSVDEGGTHGSGLFLYVHEGEGAEAFRLQVHGGSAKASYGPRHVGLAPGRGLVMVLQPAAP